MYKEEELELSTDDLNESDTHTIQFRPDSKYSCFVIECLDENLNNWID